MEDFTNPSQDQSISGSTNPIINNNIRRREPVLAVLLGIILPGGGQIYSGYLDRGLIFTLIGWAALSICVFSMYAGVSTAIIAFCGLIILWIYILHDGYKLAKNQIPNYELKWYNRWYIYIAGIIINNLINQVFQLSLDGIINK